jgi:hypothetical protein
VGATAAQHAGAEERRRIAPKSPFRPSKREVLGSRFAQPIPHITYIKEKPAA